MNNKTSSNMSEGNDNDKNKKYHEIRYFKL